MVLSVHGELEQAIVTLELVVGGGAGRTSSRRDFRCTHVVLVASALGDEIAVTEIWA